MTKKTVFKTVMLILLVLWMGLIFSLSAQEAQASSSLSGSFTERFLKSFWKGFSALSAEERADIIESLQFAVRKSAHAGIYTVLGILAMGFMYTFKLKPLTKALISLSICAAYASFDEIHQLFTQGRSGQISDVLLDTSGALAGILILMFIICIVNKLRNKRYRADK